MEQEDSGDGFGTPKAALVDENNRYLVENYSITYLSSGRDLLGLQNHADSRSQPVLIANPDYTNQGEAVFLESNSNSGFSQNTAAPTLTCTNLPSVAPYL